MRSRFYIVVTAYYSLVVSLRKKFLIISVDNREISTNIDAKNDYLSKTAVLNRDYAQYHGYDFIQIQDIVHNFVEEVKGKYTGYNIIPPTNNAKDVATAFHLGLKQFRAASWAKLPGIWHVVVSMGSKYDYCFYIDSDAAISPYHRNRSLDDLLDTWTGRTAWGNPNPRQASFVFFHNDPWRDDKPCAGSFIFKVKDGESILREWWDFDLPSKNFKHFHEQDALWHMLEHPEYGFKLNESSVSILPERQFPSEWKRYEDLWLCHISAYNYLLRVPILSLFLHFAGFSSSSSFAAEVKKVIVIRVNMLNVSEAMELASQKDSRRISKFPVHDEANQVAWYTKHTTSKDVPQLPSALLYEGRLIKFRSEFWFVLHGRRRGFTSFNSFIDLGFDTSFAFSPPRADVEAIPLGPVLNSSDSVSALTVGYEASRLGWSAGTGYRNTSASSSIRYISTPLLEKRKPLKAGAIGGTIGKRGGKGQCVPHAALDLLVAQPGYRTKMFIIAHSNSSLRVAQKYAACRDSWVTVKKIRSTVFFESIFYKDFLDKSKYAWQDFDFVVLATYKTMEVKGQTLDEIFRLLKVTKEGGYDISPFLRSGARNMEFSTYFHKKGFRVTWDALLLKLNFTLSEIRRHDNMKGFFRNAFIVRPSILQRLTKFMVHAINIAEADSSINRLLSQNANYKEGSVEVSTRIFGTSYYQLHPFIFERLPSFFLHSQGASICHNTTGPCQYNTR